MEAVLQASALLLARDGIEALNTNAVARVAGVSVGSLYQYFPDKHALVAELARGLEQRGLQLAMEKASALRDADGREGAWELVGLLLDPALGSVDLRRTLLREVPRGWIRDATRETDGAVEQLLAGFIASRPDDFRAADPRTLAFVALHAVEGVIEGALLNDPTMLRERWLHEELFQLAWRYAARDGRPWSAPSEPRPRAGGREPEAPPPQMLDRLAREVGHRVDTSPRDSVSRRGRETARAILDAAARVLTERGMSGLGARQIAAEAGVSAGALYRHFRNKQAIVAELACALERRSRALVRERLAESVGAALPDAIPTLVRIYVTADLAEPRLRQALLAEVPRRWTESVSRETERAAVAGVAGQLAARGPAIRDGDPERLAFVIGRAIESVTEAALLRHPEWIETGALENECVALALRYLRA